MGAQFTNYIHVEGVEFSLASNPLLPFLEMKGIAVEGYCNCCGDGYVTDWDITDNKLYLVDIYPCFTDEEGEKIMSMENLFPGQEIVFANWYSGNMTIVKGELLDYVHSEDNSIYEEHHYYEIYKGEVVSVRIEDNRLKHILG